MERTRANNLLGGVTLAVLIAAPLIVPSIGGIATWKIILGAAGLWIFVTAGLRR